MNKTVAAWMNCIASIALVAVARAEGPGADRTVVMISVDGLAGFYFDDPKAEMPNIRALAASGARASGMEAVTPTVTWPNHTTLVTGDFPGRHGVTGNNYFDRETKKKVALISDPVFDKDQIVKVPTIYDIAKQAGLTTAAIRWPATRNAKTLDWTVPDCGSDALELKYTTPALLNECVEAKIVAAPTEAERQADEADKTGPKRFDDQAATDAFNLVLRKHRPGLALLHVSNVDHQEHLNGPRSPEAYAAIKNADRMVGEVWQELQKDFPGRATLLVVSDHGFSDIKHQIMPNIVLRDAGLATVKGIRVVGGPVRIVPQGGSCFVYVMDETKRDDIVKKVTAAFTGLPGIYKIVGPGQTTKDYGVADPKIDPHAPDMVLFADDGYSFGDTAAGSMSFADKPEKSGTHGHDPHLPILQATFVAGGYGIKPGVKLGVVNNRDVAPTLANLLGLRMENVDGKPLTEILTPEAVASAGK